MKSSLPFIFLICILFSNCNVKSNKAVSENTKSAEDSIQMVIKHYKGSSKLVEYEIPVLKGTQIRHGIQKRYYKHGSLYSRIPYINNKREGLAYTYYAAATGVEPQVWKEQPYKNNLLNGVCKRYHRNGKLQSEYEYKDGNPRIGLKEFYESGKPVKIPSLILSKSRTSDGYFISARLSNNSENVNYFVGDLVENQYLPKGLKSLQVRNSTGETVVYKTSGEITITAVYITRYRNRCIISKTISLN